MKSALRVGGLITTTTVFLISLLVLPAFAAGSFGWDGAFQHRLQSRTWSTPDTGTHYVTKYTASCPGAGDAMQVRLVHERGLAGDDYYAWLDWDCTGTDQTRSWRSYKTDNFHFDVDKVGGGNDDWQVSGHTDYPSS